METINPRLAGQNSSEGLETKYRDIADGNFSKTTLFWISSRLLETKYRDIADGNVPRVHHRVNAMVPVGNQVPRYSGWKQLRVLAVRTSSHEVGNQVPRYSGWKPR